MPIRHELEQPEAGSGRTLCGFDMKPAGTIRSGPKTWRDCVLCTRERKRRDRVAEKHGPLPRHKSYHDRLAED